MTFCGECGIKNPDNKKFCTQCGNSINQSGIVTEKSETTTESIEQNPSTNSFVLTKNKAISILSVILLIITVISVKIASNSSIQIPQSFQLGWDDVRGYHPYPPHVASSDQCRSYVLSPNTYQVTVPASELAMEINACETAFKYASDNNVAPTDLPELTPSIYQQLIK